MNRLKHEPTGIKGVFVKEYTPTGMHTTTQVRTKDGRIYYAPSIEFVEA